MLNAIQTLKFFACTAATAALFACSPQWHVMDVSPAPKSAQTELTYDWAYEIQPGIPKYFGAKPLQLGSMQIHSAGFVVVGTTQGKLLAIHNNSAKVYWQREFSSAVTAGPIIVNNTVYIADGAGMIHALDAFNGNSLWEYNTNAPIEHGLSVEHGLLAALNANNRVFVLDANTGTLKWKRERPRPNDFAIYGQAPPLIDKETIYVGFSDGNLTAFSAQNGSALWMRELDPNVRFNDICGQIVRTQNVLFVATASGGLSAINASDGQTLWQVEINDISGAQIFQDKLFVSSNDGLYCINASDGHIIWHNPIQQSPALTTLAVGKKYLYSTAPNLGLVIVERKSGQTRHIVDLGSSFNAAAQLQNGALYLLSNNSVVYRYLLNDEPLL